MFAQAIMATGNCDPAEYNYQFDKAIAYNPEDPLFKIKKRKITLQWFKRKLM